MYKKAEMTPIEFLISFLIIILLGIVVINFTADTAEAIDVVITENSSNQTILVESSKTLSPIGSEITSDEVTAYNRTWLDFDGTNDIVNLSNYSSVNLDSNFTISTRFKINEILSLDDPYIFAKRDGVINGYNLYLADGGDNGVRVIDGAGDFGHLGFSFNDTNWHYIAYKINSSGNGLTPYFDNNEYSRITLGTIFDKGVVNLQLGNRVGGQASNYLNGTIDYLRIYNRELSRTEIYYDSLENYTLSNMTSRILSQANLSIKSVRIPKQQNSFFALGRYWVFYQNESDGIIYYESTNDTGNTWTDPLVSFTQNGLYWADWDLFNNGSDKLHFAYVINTTEINVHDGLNYSFGQLYGNGTIDFGEPQEVIPTGVSSDDISISADVNGFPFIATGIVIRKSQYNNGTWEPETWILNEYYSSLVPYNGTILGINMEWDTEQKILGVVYNGTDFNNLSEISDYFVESTAINDRVPHIDAVGCNGIAHMVYASNDTKVRYSEIYQNGSYNDILLDDEYVGNSNIISPTISCDNNTNNLYVIWQDNETGLILKERKGGIWLNSKVISRYSTYNGQATNLIDDYTFGDFIGITYKDVNENIIYNLYSKNDTYSILGDMVLNLKLNENTGTTTYDSSGNGNDGVILGASWDNDGVLNTLTNGEDYTINTGTGLFTIIDSDYSWSGLSASWDYHTINNRNLPANIVLHLIEIFIALSFIGLAWLYIQSKI